MPTGEYFEGLEGWGEGGRGRTGNGLPGKPPFNSFVHFTGKSKPWLQPAPPPPSSRSATTTTGLQLSTRELWYDTFREVVEELGIGVDVDRVEGMDLESPLGFFSGPKAIERARVGRVEMGGTEEGGTIGR